MTRAVRGAHTLAGTAGTYGLAGVSAVARSLENLLRPVQAAGAGLDEAAASAVIDHLARLKSAAERDSAGA
jgi:chemotaxis protein histidine kinase CheA